MDHLFWFVVLFWVLIHVIGADEGADFNQSNSIYFSQLLNDDNGGFQDVLGGTDQDGFSIDEGPNDLYLTGGVDRLFSQALFPSGESVNAKSYFSSTVIPLLRVFLSESLENIQNRSMCVNDTARLMNATLSGEKWTIPFVDAAGKPGPSLTLGWLNFEGNYDQCQDASSPSSTPEGGSGFNGEYCHLTFSTSIPNLLANIGVCLPDTCSELEIESLFSQMIGGHELNVTLSKAECLKDDTDVTTATVFAIVTLAIFGCLVISGTIFDLVFVEKVCLFKKTNPNDSADVNGTESITIDYGKKSKNYETITFPAANGDVSPVPDTTPTTSTFGKLLLAFSAYSNGKKVLTVTKTSDSLGSVHGIRYLSICWVMLGHTYFFGVDYSVNYTSEIPRYYNRWTFGIVANAMFSVDTFFTISGLLTSYLTLTEMAKKTWKINWPMFYFHRFWRLTPPYMFVLVTSLGLTKYLGQGPLWANEQPFDRNNCEDSWWKNLLYVNNFDDTATLCMIHSWYLANDMQFFVLSPLMLIPLYFHQTAGVVSCFIFLVASWIITGVLSGVHDWTPTSFAVDLTFDQRSEWAKDYYSKPWCRIGPFVIGVLAGYILVKIKGKSLELKWWVVALGWTLASVSALSVLFGLYGDTSGKNTSSTGAAALYNSVARSVWGAAVSWVIIACQSGYGGPVNVFLSWSPFVVLGRLTYMTYLIHPYVMEIFFQNMDSYFYMNDTTMAMYFLAFVIFSNVLAFVLMLVLESPMIGLEKLFLARNKHD